MKGWTQDGREIDLLPWQAEAVEQILAGVAEGKQVFIQRSRAGGKATVMATVERLVQAAFPSRP